MTSNLTVDLTLVAGRIYFKAPHKIIMQNYFAASNLSGSPIHCHVGNKQKLHFMETNKVSKVFYWVFCVSHINGLYIYW